jgi:hypothetical protein
VAWGGRKWCEEAAAWTAWAVQGGRGWPDKRVPQGAKAKETNPKGKCIRENTATAHGPSGPADEAVACGMGGSA